MAGVITDFLTQTDRIIHHFVFNGYQALASHYQPMIISLVVISIALVGWGVLSGWLTLSIAELTKRALTIGFVLALALQWDIFAEFVYNVITCGPQEIASQVVGSLGGGDINTGVEDILTKGMDVAANTWRAGSYNNWLPYFYAIAIIILTFLIGALGLLEIIAAKFGMAIFLVLAPLIIPLYLFKATKEAIFDGWLKHLITFAFVPIFVALVLTITVLLMKYTIGNIQHVMDVRSALDMRVLLPYGLGSFVCIGLQWRVSHMAVSIAGGISASITQGMGGFVSGKLREKSAPNPQKSSSGRGNTHQSQTAATHQPSNQTPPPKRP
jgi:type IV secretory pathway VirB6-like protein